MKRWRAELQDRSAAAITSFFCTPFPVVLDEHQQKRSVIHAPSCSRFWEDHSEKLKSLSLKKGFNVEENRRGSSLLESSPRHLLRFINLSNDESLYGHPWGEPGLFFVRSFICNYHHLSKKRQSGVMLEVLKHLTWLQDGVMGSGIRVLVFQSFTLPKTGILTWEESLLKTIFWDDFSLVINRCIWTFITGVICDL